MAGGFREHGAGPSQEAVRQGFAAALTSSDTSGLTSTPRPPC
jgi:hypothetical protein